MSLYTRAKDTRTSGCQAIDALIQSSLCSNVLEWVSNLELSNIEPVENFTDQKFFYATHEVWNKLILILLGHKDECTPVFVNEFARIHSIPTHKYKNLPNNMEFRRYVTWLKRRNEMVWGFTKYNDNYYLVADELFLSCYTRYGFCSACGILRCSQLWCICGHKELSNVWTSNNKKLDDFIKKSQIQTNSANDAYLEWIPFDCIKIDREGASLLHDLPTYEHVDLIPLDINDATDDLYYEEVIFN
jgi:hypothetical protein